VHTQAERMHEDEVTAWSSPLTAAVANCGVGLWWFDADGAFHADATLLSIWGRTADDLESADSAPSCHVHAEDRGLATEIFSRGASTKTGECTLRLLRPDGKLRWVLFRRDQSEDEATAGIAIDLSALYRANDVKSRGRALDLVATLAARLAHDFNNLLFAVVGNATLALGVLPQSGENPVREGLREIERAGTRASELVQRLSTFARPGTPRRQTLKLSALVEVAVRAARDNLPATLAIHTCAAESEPAVSADPRLVQELVSNLMSNAIHAMQGGAGVIAIEVEPVVLEGQAWLTDAVLAPGRYVELRVRDGGVGMDNTTLERCTEPFFSTRPKGAGMGIGLCIAQGVTRSHGGGLRIESVAGRGTTVRAYFPQA
jgi:signal transduction histidine kinase